MMRILQTGALLIFLCLFGGCIFTGEAPPIMERQTPHTDISPPPPVREVPREYRPTGLRGTALRPSYIILHRPGERQQVILDAWFWKDWSYVSGIRDQVTLPDDGSSMPATWSIEESSVATVDDQGIVTAVGEGETSLRVVLGNSEETAIIHVDPYQENAPEATPVRAPTPPDPPSPLPPTPSRPPNPPDPPTPPDPPAQREENPCRPTTCLTQGKNCGTIPDGCGEDIHCGTCPRSEEICGGAGIPNVCGVPPVVSTRRCSPTTCEAQGKNCGTIPDGCGETLHCGTCAAPGEICGGSGIENVCGTPPRVCRPTTCREQERNCGNIPDGCGETLDCGTCANPRETCGGGGTENVCGRPPRMEMAPPSPEMRFITRIGNFTPGRGASPASDTSYALGPPRGTGCCSGSTHTVSLGIGGEITLEFPNYLIFDGPGPDFIVFENVFTRAGLPGNFVELASVSVSEDGSAYREFPCNTRTRPFSGCAGAHPVFANSETNRISPLDPATAGGDAFDLSETGLRAARFIRIHDLDAGDPDVFGPRTNGFDLDAIAIIHGTLP